MASLSSSLNISVSALLAEQAALNVTSNNVANANTPGYSRQRVDLESLEAATLLVATATPEFCAAMAEEPSESNDNRSDMSVGRQDRP